MLKSRDETTAGLPRLTLSRATLVEGKPPPPSVLQVLPPDLASLGALRIVDAGHNAVAKWRSVAALADLPRLRQVNLMGNPLTALPDYRAKVSRPPSAKRQHAPAMLPARTRLSPVCTGTRTGPLGGTSRQTYPSIVFDSFAGRALTGCAWPCAAARAGPRGERAGWAESGAPARRPDWRHASRHTSRDHEESGGRAHKAGGAICGWG